MKNQESLLYDSSQTSKNGKDGKSSMIIAYCKNVLQKEHFDFFLFGHRHYPIDFELNNNSRYLNVGDWQFHDSFVVMRNGECELIKN